MATLAELLNLDGVVAAGVFEPDGTLVDFRAEMPMSDELAAQSAQFCATVTMLFDTLGGAFTQLSGMPWTPQHGWAYSGGQYTVAVGGRRGVFVETDKADFNKLFATLIGPR
jgi:roadblock/LC7 domain-containing protein